MALSDIRVILVHPTHPGNVGAVARAMKNMGLRQLVLVAPCALPDPEAHARAAGADDVLAAARSVATLEQAIAGCSLVIGTSARSRAIAWPSLDPRAAAEIMVAESAQGEVALVFGSERTGLTNEQLDRCHYTVSIPADPQFSSLNLACAVQVMAYEIRQAECPQESGAAGADRSGAGTHPVGSEDMERFYAHLEQVLVEIGFLDQANPRKLMRRLMRLFNRSRPDSNEMNILRGILTAVQQSQRHAQYLTKSVGNPKIS